MFEWDERKNQINIAKHGVSFATASRIFEGFVFSYTDKRKDYGEPRTLSIGAVDNVLILTVVHTPRHGKTRIISARPAKINERGIYEKALHTSLNHSGTGGFAGQ